MEFGDIPEDLLQRPLSAFRVSDDDEIDRLHARALAGDREAINGLYLALVAHWSSDLAQVGIRCLADLRARRQRQQQREANSLGGSKAAEIARAKASATAKWMKPIFDEAYALMCTDGTKQHGRKKLLRIVQQSIVGPDHPDRYRLSKIKPSHAAEYLKIHHPQPRG